MLLRAIALSSLFLVLCTKLSLAYILDGKNCMAIVEEVTEAAKIEDVKLVHFSNVSAITNVMFGEHIKLICDIQLLVSSKFQWRARHRALTAVGVEHKELDIKTVNMDFYGEYITCHAWLVSNPKKFKTVGTSIRIIGLAPPAISNPTYNNISVTENNRMTISCKIVGGVPQPILSWQMKRIDENVFRELHVAGEELTVENTTFADAGHYRCIAKNMRGKIVQEAIKTTEVIVQKLPVATIEEGSEKTFPYASNTEFNCKVDGYPLPKTIWKDSKGNELVSEDIKTNWHRTISKLRLSNVKKSNNYSCFAGNALGVAVSSINVTVLSPFLVHQYPEETTDVHYGALTGIVCNITSSFPMRIKWFHQKNANSSEKTEIQASNTKYKIRSHETRLSIMSTDLDMVGNYTCEASLVHDENEKKTFTSNLQIDDLAPPLLSDTTKTIVMEDNLVTIYCNAVEGVPSPSLSWQVKRHGDTAYTDLHTSNEKLDIENITIADAGMYRCIAKNPVGQSMRATELLVRKAPVADIKEGSTISVPYRSDNTFTCRVLAYPLPSIKWQDTKGEIIKSEDSTKHEHKIVSQITVEGIKANNKYTCGAANRMGAAKSSIHVTVLSPFVVNEHPEDTTFVHYAASRNLVCNITASFPMKIRWYHNMSEIHTSVHHTISSDETTLNIKSMDFDFVGNYTCEAYLVSDENEKKVFTTDVQIDDLRAPIVTSNTGSGDPATVTVKNLEELKLTCNVEGVPSPSLSWQVKRHGDTAYTDLHTSSEKLVIENITIEDAGMYRCIAKNPVGKSMRATELLVPKAPVAAIKEGSAVSVPYGSDTIFTCRVLAYPLPSIKWQDTKGEIIKSEDSRKNEHKIVSQITVEGIKANNKYTCGAANRMGAAKSSIHVTVLSSFVVNEHPEDTTFVHYAASRNLVCNITASFPMKIRWYHNMSEIHTSVHHTISSDETTLNIKSMDFDFVGNYTCEAYLVSDENEKKVFTTDVQIDDLRAPIVTSNTGSGDPATVTVKNLEELKLTCNVEGVPSPSLSWQVKRHGDTAYTDLHTSSEKLVIENITIEDAGMYRCIAKNPVGKSMRATELLVPKAPVAAIKEGSAVSVPYGSDTIFTCRVLAYPLPSIKWQDTKGEIIKSEDSRKNEHKIVSQITVEGIKANNKYTCGAANRMGAAKSSIHVTVLSSFVVNEHPEDTTFVHYAASRNLVCNITASFPMKIRWYHNMSEIHTSVHHTISSDETTLNIKSMDFDFVGNYTCEAYLVSDENEKKVFTTDVQIDDLRAPIVTSNTGSGDPATVTVKNLEELKLTCNVEGVPSPSLSWQVKRHGDTAYTDLHTSSEKLVIENITIEDAGMYRCIAKNPVGKSMRATELLVPKAPVAAIKEGSAVSVPYGSDTIFTCRVLAYPLPSIKWQDTKGEIIKSEDSRKNEHKIVSQITVEGIKANNKYTCGAANRMGAAKSSIHVTVLSSFVVNEHPEDTTFVHYAASRNLVCNITASFPMKIRWYHNMSEIHTSVHHTISSDETTLNIKSMDFDFVGNYTCEAYLVSDENEKKVFTTDVQIDDLRAPIVTSNTGSGDPATVTVKNLEELKLTCNVEGVPSPSLSWQVKRHGDTAYTDLHTSSEKLVIENITIEDAGMYRCIAKNPVGKSMRATELLVPKAPVADIKEGSAVSVPYGSDTIFTCRVLAYPLPSIKWQDTKGEIIKSEDSRKHEHKIVSQITVEGIKANNKYTCGAANRIGAAESSIHVTVLSPFVVNEHPDDTTYVHYAASRNLICNITASFPMKIRWYHNMSEIHTSVHHTISSDETTLNIKSMDLDFVGNYTCEAYLVSDENEKKVLTTDVQIDDLRAPIITSHTGSGATVTVKNLDALTLTCKAKGNPKPVMTWTRPDATIIGKTESIGSPNIGYEQAGTYKCLATNVAGADSRTFKVVVT